MSAEVTSNEHYIFHVSGHQRQLRRIPHTASISWRHVIIIRTPLPQTIKG